MKRVLSLAEGDVVLQLPADLGTRSNRQLVAWLGLIAHDIEEADTPRPEPGRRLKAVFAR